MNRVMICLLILAPSNTQNNPLTTALAASIQFIFGARLIAEDTESFTSLVMKHLQPYGWLGTAIMMHMLPSKFSQRRPPSTATS